LTDLHYAGRKPGMVRRLIEALSGRQVDVLLMEGTHLGSGRERVRGKAARELGSRRSPPSRR
jgi:hypothetical protein